MHLFSQVLGACMVQGKDAIEVLEHLIVGDIASLDDRTGTLSVFTNEKGGIIDDSVITRVRSTQTIQCLWIRQSDIQYMQGGLHIN